MQEYLSAEASEPEGMGVEGIEGIAPPFPNTTTTRHNMDTENGGSFFLVGVAPPPPLLIMTCTQYQ